MTFLSLEKVNRFRAGQTLFWVEARYNEKENMLFEVNFKERLLLGKKQLTHERVGEDKSDCYYIPPRAVFRGSKVRSEKNPYFQIPPPDDAFFYITYPFKRWYFTSRRAAIKFANELLTGSRHEIIKMLWDESIKRQEGRTNRSGPIRAIGETECRHWFNPEWWRGGSNSMM